MLPYTPLKTPSRQAESANLPEADMKPGEVVDMKLQGILPRRTTKQGPAPMMNSHLKDPEKNRWWFTQNIYFRMKKDIYGAA